MAELAPLVTYFNSGDFLVFTVENTRWGDVNGISVPFEGNFMGYVVAYCLSNLLGMYAPDVVAKYQADMQRHLFAAIKLIYEKVPPASNSESYSDVRSTVTLD